MSEAQTEVPTPDMPDVAPHPFEAKLPPRPTQAELDSLYTERAHLVALLISDYKGVYQEDPENPGWILVFADLPTGQVSWHIAPEDRHLFENARFAPDVVWDGHSTDTKYGRVREAIGAGR